MWRFSQRSSRNRMIWSSAEPQGQLPSMKKGDRDTGDELSDAGDQKSQAHCHEDLHLQLIRGQTLRIPGLHQGRVKMNPSSWVFTENHTKILAKPLLIAWGLLKLTMTPWHPSGFGLGYVHLQLRCQARRLIVVKPADVQGQDLIHCDCWNPGWRMSTYKFGFSKPNSPTVFEPLTASLEYFRFLRLARLTRRTQKSWRHPLQTFKPPQLWTPWLDPNLLCILMQSSLFKADWFSVIFSASCRLRDISSKTITSRLGSVLTSICSHFQDVSTQKKIKEAENPPELSRNPITPTPTNPNPKIPPDAQWRISGRAAAIATLGSPRPTSRPSASPRPVETGQLPGDALGKSVKTYGKHMENIWKTYGKSWNVHCCLESPGCFQFWASSLQPKMPR